MKTMKDSKGNNFYVGSILVSSECPDTDSGIICNSITGNIAYFTEPDFNHLLARSFGLNQNSLNTSKWIIKNK